MQDTNKEFRNDLRFLLRDKYHWSDKDISTFDMKDANIPEQVYDDIALIRAGYPLAYIIGFVEFLDCYIDLSFKTLIPRIETEHWMGQVIHTWEHASHPKKILDLCCGSGCIGISLLKHFGDVHCTFADISPTALQQTKLNLEKNGISQDRYKLVETDLFGGIEEPFDAIFTNPPYVSESQEVQQSVHHEPRKAVFSKDNGLLAIKGILEESKKHLHKNGVMYMEFDSTQQNAIAELLEKNGYTSWQFHKDQFDLDRWVEISL